MSETTSVDMRKFRKKLSELHKESTWGIKRLMQQQASLLVADVIKRTDPEKPSKTKARITNEYQARIAKLKAHKNKKAAAILMLRLKLAKERVGQLKKGWIASGNLLQVKVPAMVSKQKLAFGKEQVKQSWWSFFYSSSNIAVDSRMAARLKKALEGAIRTRVKAMTGSIDQLKRGIKNRYNA